MSVRNNALVELVRNRIMSDNRIAALPIDVYSSDGYVSLIGIVDTPEQKRVVIDLIIGLIGVREVKDELKVRFISAEAANNTATGRQIPAHL